MVTSNNFINIPGSPSIGNEPIERVALEASSRRYWVNVGINGYDIKHTVIITSVRRSRDVMTSSQRQSDVVVFNVVITSL